MAYRFNLFLAFSISILLEKIFSNIIPQQNGVILADPVTIAVVGVVVAAVGTGYGVYAGERASSDAGERYRQGRKEAKQLSMDDAARMEGDRLAMVALEKKQREEQEATDARLKNEREASLTKIRGEIPGMQDQLGSDLLKQQEYAYAKMDPQIEAKLNALGLLNSGALVEAKTKAQGELESRRQAALADFGMRAQENLNITQPLDATREDIDRQSASMRQNLETSRMNLSQNFANENVAAQNEVARTQYLASLGAAKGAADSASANSYMQFGAQVGSGLLGYAASKQTTPKTIDYNSPSLNALYRSRDAYNTNWSGPRW